MAFLDAAIDGLTAAILRDTALQRMEASWRGLHALAGAAEAPVMLRLFQATQEELAQEAARNRDPMQHPLFRLQQVEWEARDGVPCGLLLVDGEWSPTFRDTQALRALAGLAARMHAPLLTGAAPALLGLPAWSDAPAPDGCLDALPERWGDFRRDPAGAFVLPVMPRIQARGAAGAAPACWAGGAWLLAAQLARGFQRNGLGAATLDPLRLPGWAGPECPVEGGDVAALVRHGILPVVVDAGGAPDGGGAATAAGLPAMLVRCRLTHCLAMMARERLRRRDIGDYDELKTALEDSFARYLKPDANFLRALYQVQVSVRPDIEMPEQWRVALRVRLWPPGDALSAPMRVAVAVPAP